MLVLLASCRQGPAQVGETAGMISTAHPLATEAGLLVLDAGGNAFDAAVAVAATLNVVEPAMSGMGGYGTILLYHAGSGRVRFLNSSGRLPAGIDGSAYRAPTPGYLENRRGAKAVSTPGNLNAWEAMSKEYGTRPWASLFTAAIRHAEEGFVLGAREAGHIREGFPDFPEPARAIYGANGQPLAEGSRLVQTDLATTLRRVAEEGAGVLRDGAIAREIDQAMRDAGGFLTLRDMEKSEAEWWEPIRIAYRNVEVVTASPPANAFDALVRLGIMSRFDVKALGHNTSRYLHRFAEVTKHGFWVRLRWAGDPELAPPPLDSLLSEAYWAREAAELDTTRARTFVPPTRFGSRPTGQHTTHFVVADRFGNVVSATQTLGNLFGARIMPRGTGLWLNNSLAYSTFEPPGNPMDAHPGRRKLSGDVPVIVLRDGRPWIAVGTPGGHTIGQTMPQILMNLIDFDMDLASAIAAPRVSFSEPDSLDVEAAIPETIQNELRALGHKIRTRRAIGNAHGLTIEYDSAGRVSRFTGAADPRGAGLAKGLNPGPSR